MAASKPITARILRLLAKKISRCAPVDRPGRVWSRQIGSAVCTGRFLNQIIVAGSDRSGYLVTARTCPPTHIARSRR
jgi:hypothetical protein